MKIDTKFDPYQFFVICACPRNTKYSRTGIINCAPHFLFGRDFSWAPLFVFLPRAKILSTKIKNVLSGNRTGDQHNFGVWIRSVLPSLTPTTTPAQVFAARIKYINQLNFYEFLTTRLQKGIQGVQMRPVPVPVPLGTERPGASGTLSEGRFPHYGLT